MAHELKVISNNKGQALFESLAVFTLSMPLLFVLLQNILRLIFVIAVDSMAEDFFFCELAQEKNCKQKLEQALIRNRVRDIQIKTTKQNSSIILTINGTHGASFSLSREFDYAKFNQKF